MLRGKNQVRGYMQIETSFAKRLQLFFQLDGMRRPGVSSMIASAR